MKKREDLLIKYKILMGMDVKGYSLAGDVDLIMKVMELSKGMTDEQKEASVRMYEVAIDITEKENGEDYTYEDVFRNHMKLMKMTDPNNLITPISINNIEKN